MPEQDALTAQAGNDPKAVIGGVAKSLNYPLVDPCHLDKMETFQAAGYLMRNRRGFLRILVGSVGLSLLNGLAQTPTNRPVIGFLASGSQAGGAPYYGGFRLGMRERGYIEERDYTFVDRYADGDPRRLPALAEELVRVSPDVIVVTNTAAALATKRATTTIPIVCVALANSPALGVSANDAHPTANVTGVRILLEGLAAKQLEIAIDLVPTTKIAVLANVSNPTNVSQLQEIKAAAPKAGVTLMPIEVRTVDEIGPGFQTLRRAGATILIILADSMFLMARRQISAFALTSQLPTISSFREHAEDGGLISYGVNLHHNARRTAYYVDRLLKGDKPVDLPIEFPTNLELVINIATAKALGLEIPTTLLARADEVIE